jgi:hypothetical protein
LTFRALGTRQSAGRAQLSRLRHKLSLNVGSFLRLIVEGFSPLQNATLWKPIGVLESIRPVELSSLRSR